MSWRRLSWRQPAESPKFITVGFALDADDLDGKPDLQAFCADPKFAAALEVMRAKASRSAQKAAPAKEAGMPTDEPMDAAVQVLERQTAQAGAHKHFKRRASEARWRP